MVKPPYSTMPTSADSVKVVYALRNENPLLKNAIPSPADGATASELLNTYWTSIAQDQNLWNAFAHDLVNRIARTVVTSMLYESPLAFTKRGFIENGEVVQEIFVKLIQPMEYAPAEGEKRELKRYRPELNAVYHTMNYTKMYPVTVSYVELKGAFTSTDGVYSLISRIITQCYTSANYDEFLTTKYLIARSILNGFMKSYTIPATTADNARANVATIKEVSDLLTFMSTAYNPAGVETYSDKSSQYLFYTPKMSAVTDVEVLAQSFNMEKAEFEGHRVLIDSFAFSASEIKRLNKLLGESHDINGYLVENKDYVAISASDNIILKSVQAIQVDISFFMIFDNLEMMTETPVNSALEINHFYHVWKTFSTSPFASAIVYTSEESTVTEVTIEPEEVTLSNGQVAKLTANVEGTGIYSRAVTWSVPDGSGISVDYGGNVRITGSPVSGSTVTVTATSSQDTSIEGTATITIK